MRRHVNVLIGLSLLLLIGFVGGIYRLSFKNQPAQSDLIIENRATVSAEHVPGQSTKSPLENDTVPAAEVSPWPRWGGALNSAHEDGTAFFDALKAKQFSASLPAEQRKYLVELQARTFLPDTGQVLPFSEAPEKTKVVYLQFHDHPSPRERDELAALKIELLAYVNGYAWTARAESRQFQNALKLPCVRALSVIDPRDKLHAGVFHKKVPSYAAIGGDRARFRVLAANGTSEEAFVREVGASAPLAGIEVRPGNPSVLGPRFEIIADANLGNELAALDSATFVEWISPPAKSRDFITDDSSNITDVRDNPSVFLDGSGVTVAVREIGRMNAHADFASRLTYIDDDGSTFGGDANHATAVTGQVGSNGISQSSALGVAPAVRLLGYSVGLSDTFTTADILNAASKNVRISNHSYGPTGVTIWGDYDSDSADWDAAIRNNDLIAAFASNEENGGLFKHIDAFVGSKNTICVAATTSAAHSGDDSPLASKADGIASFCEHGPMNDGRIKPDLVAYGENVTLAMGTDTTRMGSGTSFSTPAVSGMAALLLQHFRTRVGSEPSAALMKALLCNSATDLGLAGPDAIYGFGIANLEKAVATVNLRQSVLSSPLLEDSLNNGETRSFNVNVQNSTQLKLTLCWMDVAGNPTSAKALVNDLDLELEAPNGSVFFPFSLNANEPAAAATASAANTVDPIEQIVIDNPPSGKWILRVIGRSVPQGPQSFGLALNQPTEAPSIAAVIVASPSSGPAPLVVAFSAEQSIGQFTNYSWIFGDGGTAEGTDKITVSHTYAATGAYTVTLTLDGTASDTTIIQVTKPERSAFAGSMRGKLSMQDAPITPDDQLQFTMIATDLVRTSQQARDAINIGTFEGKTYLIKIGGTADRGVPSVKVADAILDRKASFKGSSVSLKLSLIKGEFKVQLRKKALEDALAASGILRTLPSGPLTLHDLPIEIETDDAIYRAVYRVTFKHNGKSGSIKR